MSSHCLLGYAGATAQECGHSSRASRPRSRPGADRPVLSSPRVGFSPLQVAEGALAGFWALGWGTRPYARTPDTCVTSVAFQRILMFSGRGRRDAVLWLSPLGRDSSSWGTSQSGPGVEDVAPSHFQQNPVLPFHGGQRGGGKGSPGIGRRWTLDVGRALPSAPCPLEPHTDVHTQTHTPRHRHTHTRTRTQSPMAWSPSPTSQEARKEGREQLKSKTPSSP